MDKPRFTKIDGKVAQVRIWTNKDGATCMDFDKLEHKIVRNNSFFEKMSEIAPQVKAIYCDYHKLNKTLNEIEEHQSHHILPDPQLIAGGEIRKIHNGLRMMAVLPWLIQSDSIESLNKEILYKIKHAVPEFISEETLAGYVKKHNDFIQVIRDVAGNEK